MGIPNLARCALVEAVATRFKRRHLSTSSPTFALASKPTSTRLIHYLTLTPLSFLPPQEIAKKRTRRTVKQQRGIVGAPLELIKDRRAQRPEAREAARKEAIAKGKEKKATAESKKKAEKAKSAAGAARGQPGRIQSKMGAKGAANKVNAKTR